MLTKEQLKGLPKIVGDDAQRQMDYVLSVLDGREKIDALREHFPDLYTLAIERANGNQSIVKANITSQVNWLERKSAVKKMYAVASKHEWTNFVAKKMKKFKQLDEISDDEDNSMRDRLSAIKTYLDHMPKFEEDKTLVVEVKDNKDDFVKSLKSMQKMLLEQSKKTEAEIIDVEEVDGQ